jgi:hypothetical protein
MADRPRPGSNADTARFDAMKASPAQVRERLRQLGIHANRSVVEYGPPGTDDPQAVRIAHREQARILARDARQQARAAAATAVVEGALLDRGRIDGRTATADDVRARARQLGIAINPVTDALRDPPKQQLAARPDAPDPTSTAARIEREARELLGYVARGGRVDARTIEDPQVAARFMALRFANPGQWG